MCGRYHIIRPISQMAAIFGFEERPNMPSAYNIAPTMPVPIVRKAPHTGRNQLAFVRWGLVPSWSKDPLRNPPLINARVETVWEKPSFKSAILRRRCLMPADGFWEWQRDIGGDPKRKQAFRVHRTDDTPMAFAAIWEHWIGADGSEIESVAMLTTHPNDVMAAIHHRMPIILEPHQFEDWLSPRPELETKRHIDAMMVPCSNEILTHYPVDNRVGSIRHDDPGLLTPLDQVAEASDAGDVDGTGGAGGVGSRAVVDKFGASLDKDGKAPNPQGSLF